MKLLFVALFTAASFFSANAQGDEIPSAIRESFYANFPSRSNPDWTKVGHLYRAEFSQDNQKQYAFFSNTGEFLVQAHFLRFSSLPERLSYELIKQYAEFTIVDLFEVQNEDEHDYFAIIERNGVTVTLKSVNMKWKLFDK